MEFRKRTMDELNRLTAKEFSNERKFPFVLILDSIRSLNNVGSVFRTADSFKSEGIYLCGLTGTPPHRDIQKTALGATESVGWTFYQSITDCILALKEKGYFVFAIEQATGSEELQNIAFDKEKKYAFVLGNEISGVSEEALQFVDGVIEIPQFGTKHSLNVAVTAGIISWDFVRFTLAAQI
jgi:23S rRNA (guanosine2251-2'-O)-methyltransferase